MPSLALLLQLAIVGATIYHSPDAAPIRDGVLIISGERITAVGDRATVPVPRSATVLDARGTWIVPAFWNCHVHLMDAFWENYEQRSVAQIDSVLRAMFTRYGVVHIFETASLHSAPALDLRRRVNSGEILGPDVFSVLQAFTTVNGQIRYVPARFHTSELADAAAARDSVRARLAEGADAVKLFTVPLTRTRPYPVMPLDIVRAVTEEAHAKGKLVFAHPSNLAGVTAAVYGGVDILAHTAPDAGALSGALLGEMRARRVALIPTLALFEDTYGADTAGMSAYVRTAEDQVRAYRAIGGRILFGTDEGFTTHYDPTREYELLAAAGLGFRDILATMTTAPADEFSPMRQAGTLTRGEFADLVVLSADPAADIRSLARVRRTIRHGRTLYSVAVGNHA
jgi:imidazolonepropionase-like amidohydrolase